MKASTAPPMIIKTNSTATAAAQNLSCYRDVLNKALNRLSPGSRAVQPPDDAAGLAVSEKMSARNRRLHRANRNVQNAKSYIQTADGFMSGMSKVLARMSELATMAGEVTRNPSDIASYRTEFRALQQQLRDTVDGSTFRGIPLFGPNATGLCVTIGEGEGQTISIGESNLQNGEMAAILAQSSPPAFDLTVTLAAAADLVIAAMEDVATERAILRAAEWRLDAASTTLAIEAQNIEAAIAPIRDVDAASERTEMAKRDIRMRSGPAMLARAHRLPLSVLRLLQ